jgi:hypothetical protein
VSRTSSDELALLAAFPAWRDLARTEIAEDGSSSMLIQVDAPVEASVEHGLVVDTSRDEVTVAFDAHHEHFNEHVGDGERFGVEAAIEFIKSVISERVVVLSMWRGELWCGSATVEAVSDLVAPEWFGPEAHDRVRARSWKGSFNLDAPRVSR